MNEDKSNLEQKLFTVKYCADVCSHLKPVPECCKVCVTKACTVVCPAGVYEWNEDEQKLIVNFENCLECGACRIACERKCMGWEYPKGTKGVTFKQG